MHAILMLVAPIVDARPAVVADKSQRVDRFVDLIILYFFSFLNYLPYHILTFLSPAALLLSFTLISHLKVFLVCVCFFFSTRVAQLSE